MVDASALVELALAQVIQDTSNTLSGVRDPWNPPEVLSQGTRFDLAKVCSCSGGARGMTGPEDEIARAAGRGYLRASHADCEQLVGTLKTAFVQDMLDKDEFDLRLGHGVQDDPVMTA